MGNAKITYGEYILIITKINQVIDEMRADYAQKKYGKEFEKLSWHDLYKEKGKTKSNSLTHSVMDKFPKRIVVEMTD